MYHLLKLFKKKILPLYRHFSDLKSHCVFSIAGAGFTIFQFEKGISCP